MSKPLKNKLALVTGSSRGIGAAIAIRLAAEGASVILNYAASPERAEKVVKEIRNAGGKAEAVGADLARPATGEDARGDGEALSLNQGDDSPSSRPTRSSRLGPCL
jgi:NAD(P)-dependent dehydrogenase (short-subunit alcohol dehydrogenase family)